MKEKDIKYSCLVDTNYALALYLLYMPEDAINKTLFFVGNAVPQLVTSKLKFVVWLDSKSYNGKIEIFKHRIEALLKWRCRHNTIFYAQDHLAFSSHIIGSNEYVLLEDAPNIFTAYKDISFMRPRPDKSLYEKIVRWILFGRIRRNILGTNSLCKKIIYTSLNDEKSELLLGKLSERVELKKLWNNASEAKKNIILNVYSLNTILNRVSDKKVIIFSQPLMSDCGLTEEEIIKIYKPYIEKYASRGVVVKPHPRDKFDYKRKFNVDVLNTPAPMQLLSAMGLSFQVAITVCSSAVSSMSKETEIIWLGTEINPKIQAVYGQVKCPVI